MVAEKQVARAHLDVPVRAKELERAELVELPIEQMAELPGHRTEVEMQGSGF